MIAGFVMTAGFVGKFLNPFSADRLILIAAIVCLGGFALSSLSLVRLETKALVDAATKQVEVKPDFKVALVEVWHDQTARRFAIFIFVSMLAYSAQELVLEPFGALVFGMSPSETALLGGAQHGGALAGMILVGTLATVFSKSRFMALRNWIMLGCAGSALALMGLVAASRIGPAWPLVPSIFALGLANGIYAVAAIGSMFNLAASGGEAREGLRMGLFGAAQGVAFGIGGFAGSGLSDLMRLWLGSPVGAYSIVFGVEALLFFSAAFLAAHIGQTNETRDDRGAFPQPQKAQLGINGG